MSNTTLFSAPLGGATTQTLTAADTAQAITVTNTLTVVDGVTNARTANVTLTVAIPNGLQAGARMLLKTKSNATETLTFSTGFSAPVLTGVAGKTINRVLIFDGTAFTLEYGQVD